MHQENKKKREHMTYRSVQLQQIKSQYRGGPRGSLKATNAIFREFFVGKQNIKLTFVKTSVYQHYWNAQKDWKAAQCY